MHRTTDVITIFYSTTTDGYAERRAKFNQTIKMLEQARNVSIKVLDWQENIPGGISGEDGQARINAEVYNTFDIYFGCLGVKFGSGTVEEFEQAIEGHIRHGRPAEVLFAFDESKVNPFAIPGGFDRVLEFRRSIQTDEKYDRSILYFTFDGLDQFQERAFRDLDAAIRHIQGRVRGGMPSPN